MNEKENMNILVASDPGIPSVLREVQVGVNGKSIAGSLIGICATAEELACGIPEEPRRNFKKHSHYYKSVKHLDEIDIYRVLEIFNVTDQPIGHAIKKLLCAGIRGAKDKEKDIQEVIDTLIRWQEMKIEDCIK